MACSISGEIAIDPVVSLKSGHLFERRLIEKQISATGKCPITEQDLTKEDLLSVKSHQNQKSSVIKPRLTSAAGIPGVLKSLQDEWDAVMLETFTLKKHLNDVRQELAYALYQKDAACRVIARLVKERDQARAALSDVQSNMAVAVGKAAPDTMDVEDEKGITSEIVRKMQATAKKLSNKARKTKVKGLQLSVAKPDDLAKYDELSSHPLHSSSKPGVLCLDLHPTNQDLVVTGGADHHAIIFNRKTKKIVDTLKYHKKKVNSVLFHPTSNVVFSTSADGTGIIWGPQKGKFTAQHVLSDHSADVVGCTLHPSGDYLVTASADASWCFYDVATAACRKKVTSKKIQTGYTSVAFHPDGLILAGSTADATIRIFDVKTQKKLADFDGHKANISGISFSENGYHLGSVDESGVVKMWDLRKLSNFHTMEAAKPLSDIAFDLSGTYMAVAGKTLSVYSVKGFSLVKEWKNHKKPVTSAKFGKDASFIASTSKDRTLKFFGI